MTDLERQRQEAMILVDNLKLALLEEVDTKKQGKILKDLNAARLTLSSIEGLSDEVSCLRCGCAVNLRGNDFYSFKAVEVITPYGMDNLNHYGECLRLIYCGTCGPVILEEVVD